MNDDRKGLGLEDSDFEDDAPTDRILSRDVPVETDPTHAAVLDANIAARIAQDLNPTLQDDGRITFVATVDEDGRLVIPDHFLASGALAPGDELVIHATKVGG